MSFARRLYHSATIHKLMSASSSTVNTPQRVAVNGWIKSVRKQKKVAFAVVSDGSDIRGLQLVFPDPSVAKDLTNGASVLVKGDLVASPSQGQEKELLVKDLEVLGESDPQTYPIQKQTLSTEYLRDNVHLRARTDRIAAMLRLRSHTARTLGTWFEDQGFINVHTPILTGNDCEGAGEAFKLAPAALHPDATPSSEQDPSAEFFSRPAYLSVSAQLHLEALAWAMGRVYTLGPCFRAEHSMTGRHLSEFWMLEAEWNLDSGNELGKICDTVEGSLKHLLTSIHDASPGMLEDSHALDLDANLRKPWPRMTYDEAINILKESEQNFKFPVKWGNGLQSEHEKFLAEEVVKSPLFVTDYPKDVKPFYMRINPDGRTVGCFDLLVPGIGELAGGSVREDRLDRLLNALPPSASKDLEWYVDLRRHGSSPHGGFGIGFERLICWISGIDNIRESIPVPRWAGRLLL